MSKYILRVLEFFVICLTAHIPFLRSLDISWIWILLLVSLFIIINIVPSYDNVHISTRRLRMCADGCELLILFIATLIPVIAFFIMLMSVDCIKYIIDGICLVIVEAILFWNGMLRIFILSSQLRMKWRVLGLLCGWIPIVNVFVLMKMISIVLAEVEVENAKIMLEQERYLSQICQTQYPILLVHGVFFRDSEYFNYWGRIPAQLEKNGAKVFYGNHQSAASVAESAAEISERIREIIREEQVEKVNIIAHSKGGLDCRYAVSMLGMDRYVASLTTINTPHRGCLFADVLLSKIPESVKGLVAEGYNATLRKLGDDNPDFISAVTDLTASSCQRMNDIVKDKESVYYQSVGSVLKGASSGQFPLNMTYYLVKYFDGPNDGLVRVDSFRWGENFVLLQPKGKRGISHGDMIDLNRENIEDFDVREFYVDLVKDLKEKGY